MSNGTTKGPGDPLFAELISSIDQILDELDKKLATVFVKSVWDATQDTIDKYQQQGHIVVKGTPRTEVPKPPTFSTAKPPPIQPPAVSKPAPQTSPTSSWNPRNSLLLKGLKGTLLGLEQKSHLGLADYDKITEAINIVLRGIVQPLMEEDSNAQKITFMPILNGFRTKILAAIHAYMAKKTQSPSTASTTPTATADPNNPVQKIITQPTGPKPMTLDPEILVKSEEWYDKNQILPEQRRLFQSWFNRRIGRIKSDDKALAVRKMREFDLDPENPQDVLLIWPRHNPKFGIIDPVPPVSKGEGTPIRTLENYKMMLRYGL